MLTFYAFKVVFCCGFGHNAKKCQRADVSHALRTKMQATSCRKPLATSRWADADGATDLDLLLVLQLKPAAVLIEKVSLTGDGADGRRVWPQVQNPAGSLPLDFGHRIDLPQWAKTLVCDTSAGPHFCWNPPLFYRIQSFFFSRWSSGCDTGAKQAAVLPLSYV